MFLFENLTSDKECLINFELVKENLEGDNKWVIALKPGQVEIRKLKVDDVSKKSSLKYQYCFKTVDRAPEDLS
jgi:hypothetical protein